MFVTIWMCTHEWSDMPRRSALTPAAYHQALTWSSPLTASTSACRRRLPRVGTRISTPATRSPSGLGASSLLTCGTLRGSGGVALLGGPRRVAEHQLALQRPRLVARHVAAPRAVGLQLPRVARVGERALD